MNLRGYTWRRVKCIYTHFDRMFDFWSDTHSYFMSRVLGEWWPPLVFLTCLSGLKCLLYEWPGARPTKVFVFLAYESGLGREREPQLLSHTHLELCLCNQEQEWGEYLREAAWLYWENTVAFERSLVGRRGPIFFVTFTRRQASLVLSWDVGWR